MPDFVCGASRDLPLDTDTAWDGAAAKASMFEWAGYNGDSPDSAKLKRGFLIYDRSAPDLKGSFHLPFAAVQDGKLTCLISGCRAAASRLPQLEGLSDAEQTKARGVLDGYFAKAKPEGSGANALEGTGYFGFPARVLSLEERATAPSNQDELLAIARERAHDPTIFDEFPPLFFPAAVSTNKLDAYSTSMHASSLRNFAEDLNAGVSLQDSHDTRRLGIGYSLRGKYVGASGQGAQRAIGDFFTTPATPDMAEFTQKLRAGAVRDVSVGFYGGRWMCDMCGQDMMRSGCPHYPGMSYDVNGQMQTATATIHDARLAEVSVVYDGATPGAAILKAQRAAEAGLLAPDIARTLETQYRIALPAARHSWAGIDTDRQESEMANKPIPPGGDGTFTEEQIRSTLQEANWTLGSDLTVSLRELAETAHASAAHEKRANDAEKERDTLKKETERLAPLADLGTLYRSDLIEEAVSEGARAFGNAYPTEQKRLLLTKGTVDEIKAERDMNKGIASQTLSGGRVTIDPDRDADSSRRDLPPATPNAAYRA